MQRGEKSAWEAKQCPRCGTPMKDSGKVSIETGIMNRIITYYTFTCQECGRVEFFDYATINRKQQGQR
jgi:RNase P subunit RPR2